MAIYAPQNLYPGINPHLHSFMQQPDGGWSSFHTVHIVDLHRAINRHLPAGYYAIADESLQIAIYDPPYETRTIVRPDVMIKSGDYPRALTSSAEGTVTAPTLIIPIEQTVSEPETIMGITIYQVAERKYPGTPVVRIELLSPANKPRGRHYGDYMKSREKTLRAGLRLVELDYLHETPPILAQIPSYAERQPAAYPYHIIVTDPRPSFEKGSVQVYSFGVTDRLPIIALPLERDDSAVIDFGAPYEQTFADSVMFPGLVDYAQPPINFEAYTDADRERIRAHMAAIAAEQPTRE